MGPLLEDLVFKVIDEFSSDSDGLRVCSPFFCSFFGTLLLFRRWLQFVVRFQLPSIQNSMRSFNLPCFRSTIPNSDPEVHVEWGGLLLTLFP